MEPFLAKYALGNDFSAHNKAKQALFDRYIKVLSSIQ